VLRSALFSLLIAASAGFAQEPVQKPEPQTSAAPSQSPPTQVLQVEAAIAKADWKAAEAVLTPWLAAHPDDSEALFDAGYVADAQNRQDDAVALYKRAIEGDPLSFEAHLSLGLLLARLGKLSDARTELAAATYLDPGTGGPALKARTWRALAQIDRKKSAADASNDLIEALKISPETPDDALLAANLADQAGEFDAAETAYRRILAKDPKSADANAGLAHLMIERKLYPQAEAFLQTALEQTPDDPALTAQLATVLAAQDKAEALPLVQKLHDAHPTDAAMTRMLAEVLATAGDAAGSDHYYVALLASAPNDAALLIGHGQNLIRQLKYPEAFAAFNKATELDPADADGWSGLAFAASRTNQPSITLHALTMRSKYLPEGASTYFLWATSYDSMHDRAAAVTFYHHFLDASAGKFPDQEFRARQRLLLLEKKP